MTTIKLEVMSVVVSSTKVDKSQNTVGVGLNVKSVKVKDMKVLEGTIKQNIYHTPYLLATGLMLYRLYRLYKRPKRPKALAKRFLRYLYNLYNLYNMYIPIIVNKTYTIAEYVECLSF